MGATGDDLGTLGGLADLDDVGLDPATGLGALVGHLLGLGQQGLDPTEVEQRVAGIGLLDDAGDDVALAAGVLLVLHLALGFTDALPHDLLGRLGGDAAEVVGRHVELGAGRFALLVELLGHDPDLGGVGVDGDPGVLLGVGHPLVGGLERIGEGAEQRVDGDALVGGERLQGIHQIGVLHDGVTSVPEGGSVVCWAPVGAERDLFGLLVRRVPGLEPDPGFGAGPHSKTVRAFSMSA